MIVVVKANIISSNEQYAITIRKETTTPHTSRRDKTKKTEIIQTCAVIGILYEESGRPIKKREEESAEVAAYI